MKSPYGRGRVSYDAAFSSHGWLQLAATIGFMAVVGVVVATATLTATARLVCQRRSGFADGEATASQEADIATVLALVRLFEEDNELVFGLRVVAASSPYQEATINLHRDGPRQLPMADDDFCI